MNIITIPAVLLAWYVVRAFFPPKWNWLAWPVSSVPVIWNNWNL
ncbi:hypothetical protein [Pseudomonas putida]